MLPLQRSAGNFSSLCCLQTAPGPSTKKGAGGTSFVLRWFKRLLLWSACLFKLLLFFSFDKYLLVSACRTAPEITSASACSRLHLLHSVVPSLSVTPTEFTLVPWQRQVQQRTAAPAKLLSRLLDTGL
ncbi:hypothetical protein BDW74DRAFT_155602 [Aspergillus multicolor]|uniref:uncharacterized protein n=1 Tax=Aspergillus multicolor TaxID=41759 RepID=UPI003CCD711C